MIAKPLDWSAGFSVDPGLRATFVGTPSFYELSGPGTLVRLVQKAKTSYEGLQLEESGRDGRFWFEESFLLQVRSHARRELEAQQRQSGRPFRAPLDALVTLYVRHYLRGDLAVCKDWTHDFDGHVRLRLEAGDRLVALVGWVAAQPAYSSSHPEHKSVVEKGILLRGQATQYVVDFRFPPNRPYASRIMGPFGF